MKPNKRERRLRRIYPHLRHSLTDLILVLRGVTVETPRQRVARKKALGQQGKRMPTLAWKFIVMRAVLDEPIITLSLLEPARVSNAAGWAHDQGPFCGFLLFSPLAPVKPEGSG